MKDMKLSNIQKESEKIKIKKSINEYEDLKSQSLLKLGIMTFDKIRKNEIHDKYFNEICEEIKNYDIEIDEVSKFCSCCGNKIEEIQYTYKEKENCDDEEFAFDTSEEIEKVDILHENKKDFLDEETYEENILNNHLDIDEKTKDDTFLEKKGREFLKSHEENTIK